METLTIRPPKSVSLDKAKLALENLNFEIITNTNDRVQVSPEILNMIDDALEEEKKGIFISNEVVQEAREFIQKNGYLNKKNNFIMKYDRINTIFSLQKKLVGIIEINWLQNDIKFY